MFIRVLNFCEAGGVLDPSKAEKRKWEVEEEGK